jgi:signal transduction histidine kinase
VLTTFGGSYKRLISGEHRIPITRGLMGAAARGRETVLVNDVLADPRYAPTPFVDHPQAELVVPILIGDRLLGLLNVESSHRLTSEDAELLRVVADQLAVAIENARLYAAAQQVATLNERQRLARELHDSVTQLLFSATLLAESLVPAWRRDAEEGERRTDRLLALSREALAEMRALLRELHPVAPAPPIVHRVAADSRPTSAGAARRPARAGRRGVSVSAGGAPGIAAVRALGLPAALAEHARVAGIAAGDDLNIELDSAGYAAQPPAVEEVLYRIAQEALNNVVKHARAHRARLTLAADAAGVRLTVEDDGVGFPDAAPAPNADAEPRAGPGGLGLVTMHERARGIGGAVRIVTRPGSGTAVHVSMPASVPATTPAGGGSPA